MHIKKLCSPKPSEKLPVTTSDTHNFSKVPQEQDHKQQHNSKSCCCALLNMDIASLAEIRLKAGIYSPVLDLPTRHGFIVKLKPLKVDDQSMWQALYAAAFDCIHLLIPCMYQR